MSKKQQRIKYLVGCINELNNAETGADGSVHYKMSQIKAVLATLTHLLKEDGIAPINANEKVEGEE